MKIIFQIIEKIDNFSYNYDYETNISNINKQINNSAIIWVPFNY